MVGVPGWLTALIWLSAGPGLTPATHLPAINDVSRSMIPLPTSRGANFNPVFAPLAPYHSWHITSEPRGGHHVLPSSSLTSVPSASANHDTANGCVLPQSKERSTRQLCGTLKRGTMARGDQTSSSAPPATM